MLLLKVVLSGAAAGFVINACRRDFQRQYYRAMNNLWAAIPLLLALSFIS